MRQRKRGTGSTPAAKRVQLEDKLDDLVSLLRTHTATSSVTSSGGTTLLTPRSLVVSPQALTEPMFQSVLTEQHLDYFREHHLQYFPFMLLPGSVTADALHQEKPILSLTIRTICTKAISMQSKLSKQVREALAEKILVNGERNFDLLLSCIVCTAW